MMTADRISAELAARPSIARLEVLPRDCEGRRVAIRERLSLIARSPTPSAIPHGPVRRAAMTTEANAALDAEEEALQRELQLLDDLERMSYEALVAAKLEAARAAAPGARRKLPSAGERVRKALAELDAAIAAVGTLLEPLAAVADAPGETFPLSDDEAAALLELREAVWTRRDVPALIPLNRETHPRAWGIFHEVRSDGYGERIIRRPGPIRVYLPDYR
jgi:hypothetical protein